MKRNPPLTKGNIDNKFIVNCEIGKIFWKKSKKKYLIGKEAGGKCQTSKKYCYMAICVNGILYRRSHIIYFYHTGKWPSDKFVIDHINRDPLDDRINNLREITQQQNLWNTSNIKHQKNNLPRGVFLNKNRPSSKIIRITAKINYCNKQIFLGHYKTVEDAYISYLNARKKYYGEFA
jgi:hypothetical protein